MSTDPSFVERSLGKAVRHAKLRVSELVEPALASQSKKGAQKVSIADSTKL